MTDTPKPFYLGAFDYPDDEVENRMISELDAILGQPERVTYPEGTLLFEEDQNLEGIWILMEGSVELFKSDGSEQVVYHAQTAGRILGLLALAEQSRAFFSCRARSTVTVIPVPIQHLDAALQLSEGLQATFITVLLKSMARRNKRLVEVQKEVLTLNREIAAKHREVAQALEDLKQAQAMLVESEKMATLGQLSAGVAHELNNPVAAIVRAAEFARKDLEKLAHELPNGKVLLRMLKKIFDQEPVSTREQRAFRRDMNAELDDLHLATRLVNIGIHSTAEYQALSNELSGSEEKKLETLELYHQLGMSLRNMDRCSSRISNLVSSLRSYVRADQREVELVSVHRGIDDTLALFSNRMHDVEVEKEYSRLPLLKAHGGELNQVWTNLISNALDAMQDKGHLRIRTETRGNSIAVQIIDDGPGIPAENINKIFELRFTTRKGRVDFGLGLGLSITRNIVQRHGGAIHVASKPGRTEFSVTLPVEGPGGDPSSSQEKPS